LESILVPTSNWQRRQGCALAVKYVIKYNAAGVPDETKKPIQDMLMKYGADDKPQGKPID
jgi:hypothetical protein